MLITLSGISCSGKSTQVQRMEKLGWIQMSPYSSKNGLLRILKMIGQDKSDPKGIFELDSDFMCLCRMVFNYHKTVLPMTNIGKNVIFDHFFFDVIPRVVDVIEPLLTYLKVYPYEENHRHLYLKIDLETYLNRHWKRDNPQKPPNIAMIKNTINWHDAVADAGYLIPIDASRSPEHVTKEIMKWVIK